VLKIAASTLSAVIFFIFESFKSQQYFIYFRKIAARFFTINIIFDLRYIKLYLIESCTENIDQFCDLMFFCIVTPEDGDSMFPETFYLPTSSHDIITQKTNIDM
jgi:hypothetical protein